MLLEGMATRDDVFHLGTYSNANYSTINWLWDSNPALHGPAPGYPWSRWVYSETNMPPQGSEAPYLDQLVSLQLADEWDLNTDAVRTRAVNWFNAVRTNWPNTILYGNNWGGQVLDAPLADFIARAQPDMLCFDTYPWQSVYTPNHDGAPIGGPPSAWYRELRRYRAWATTFNIPYAAYRQTFHAVQDYNSTVYRDPSPSELRLNTFAALAFDAKGLIDFTYNTGASSLFTSPGGDTYTNLLYGEQADINRRARNLGRALLRLRPVYDLHNTNVVSPPPGPGSDNPAFPTNGYTTSIMFVRGKFISGGVTNFTPVPDSLLPDPDVATANPANPVSGSYTWWEYGKNDPYLSGGFTVATNKAAIKNDGLPGDVIYAWFRPLDESMDGPAYSNQVYIMVVNALTATNGTAADCLQQIRLDFSGLSGPMTNLIMLDPATGQLQTNGLPLVSSKRRLTVDLNGGDAILFKFNTGAPFVGVTPVVARLDAAVQDGIPAITIQGAIGSRYELQCSDTLPAANWTTLTNLSLPTAAHTFLDTTYPGTGRFYRALANP